MLQKISKLSIFVILPLAALSLLATNWDWRFGSSVLLGGLVSLASFRAITWAVRKFLGTEMGQPIIMGLSVLKIMAIFILLVVLAIFGLVHPVGLVIGFTAVLVIIIKEGYLFARREAQDA
jgi:F0F1-type ATP synthase assembly protein I